MIIATNRQNFAGINRTWGSRPDTEGHVHWMVVDDADGKVTGTPQTSTNNQIPVDILDEIEKTVGSRKHLLVFAPGARPFNVTDFTKYQFEMTTKRNVDALVIGYSSAFSDGLDVVPLHKQFRKSHESRISFSNFIAALATVQNLDLSLILQSAGNDVCARAFNRTGVLLPKLKCVVSTASPVDRSAYEVGANAAVEVPDEPVNNTLSVIKQANVALAYYRFDDYLLRLLPATNWFKGPRPLGLKPPEGVIPKNLICFDCGGKPTEGNNHSGYENEPAILDHIAASLNSVLGSISGAHTLQHEIL